MLKKFLSVIFSLLLVVGLVACGGGSATNFSSDGDNSSVSSGGSSNDNLKSQIQNCTPITEYAGNTSVDQMDTIIFGMDKNGDAIEWIVLEKNSNKALLLSKYLIDGNVYNNEIVDITWENCTCRKWLNSDFMNQIFNKKEQNSILVTDVINNDNAEYGSNGGNNTKDKLFFLSLDEFNKYFSLNVKAKTKEKNDDWMGGWWLRSYGTMQKGAQTVGPSGSVGALSVKSMNGIRPALWVKN